METVYFGIFAAVCFLLFGAVILRPQRIYEYPYFMGVGFAIFALPQLYAILSNPGSVPDQALESLLLMCLFCLALCWLGYQVRLGFDLPAAARPPLDPDRLFQVGVVFVAAGSAFFYLIAELPEEMKGSMWTGRATIYHFFSLLVYPGFAICLFCALHQPTLATVGVTVAATLVPLLQAVVYARREPTALFLLTIGLALYFRRGLVPSRLVVALVLAFALLFMPVTGLYRSLAGSGAWDQLRDINYWDHFVASFQEARAPEMRLAARVIRATQREGSYCYGADYWDQLVARYVPGQIVGQEFKESLMIGQNTAYLDWLNVRDHNEIPFGTTQTGIADAFKQFGYPGCLFFGLAACLFQALWGAARHDLAAQLFYSQNVTVAVRAMTHQTSDFLPGMFFNVLFFAVAIWYARRPAAEGAWQ